MLLKSQIGSGVVRRSMDFIHHYQVDDEEDYRHEAVNCDVVYVGQDSGDVTTNQMLEHNQDGKVGQSDQCQTDDNLLRSACYTQRDRLYT